MNCTLFVEGVHCAACVWLVEKLPSLVRRDERAAQLETSLVRLQLENASVSLAKVAAPSPLASDTHPTLRVRGFKQPPKSVVSVN